MIVDCGVTGEPFGEQGRQTRPDQAKTRNHRDPHQENIINSSWFAVCDNCAVVYASSNLSEVGEVEDEEAGRAAHDEDDDDGEEEGKDDERAHSTTRL